MCVNGLFLKNRILAIAKQTFLQAELCQILGREFGKVRVSGGFWIHFIGACWQAFSFFLFRAGASALKLFFAGDGYADSHISTASTSHRGEDLCSLNTTSWGWSFWQHSMRHLIFSIPRTSDPCVDLPALRTNVCKDATLPDICAAEQHVAEEVQGTWTCPPHPTPSWLPNTRLQKRAFYEHGFRLAGKNMNCVRWLKDVERKLASFFIQS